eukprot:g1460.t1
MSCAAGPTRAAGQETGALLKAIKLAKRADDAVRENPEYAIGRRTHEESIKEAEQLVAFLEVDLQLPRAIRSKDQQKLKDTCLDEPQCCLYGTEAVLTKASTWSIETEDVMQGQMLLGQIEAEDALRAAINSKSEDQLVKALEEASQRSVDRVRSGSGPRGWSKVVQFISEDPETLEEAIQKAKEAGVPRSEVSKAEALVKSLCRSPTRSLAVSRVECEGSAISAPVCQATLKAVAQDRSELASMYRRANQELCRLRAELSQRTLEVLELRQESRQLRQPGLNKCVVCLDETARLAFVPCGHLASCEICAAQIHPLQCPVCRQKSESVLPIYLP